jgi:hypothetical protein
MKQSIRFVVLSLVFLSAAAAGVRGQEKTGPSGLTVLDHKWSKSTLASVDRVDEDPFAANNEATEFAKDTKTNKLVNEQRQREGKPLEPPPVRGGAPLKPTADPAAATTPPPAIYSYLVRVRNDGAKTIGMVEWDYIFLDPIDKTEVGRHTARTETVLKPGREDKLVLRIGSPPSLVVNAKYAGKKGANAYIERIEIKSVHFTDGSSWRSK